MADSLFPRRSHRRTTQLTDREAMKIILRYAYAHRLSKAHAARLIAKWRRNQQRAMNQGEPLN